MEKKQQAIIEVLEPDAIIEKFGIDTSGLDAAKAEYSGLDASIPDQYKLAVKGRALFRDTRLAIETRRKDLKEFPLRQGKNIDLAAKTLTALCEPTEQELDRIIKAADKVREDARNAKAEAERRKVEEAARAKAEAEAQAERDRIAAEDRRISAERETMKEEIRQQKKLLARQEQALHEAKQREEAERAARLELERKEREQREAQEKRDREAREFEEQARLVEQRRIAEEQQAKERERIRVDMIAALDRQKAADEAQAAADEAKRQAVAERERLEHEEERRQFEIRHAQQIEIERIEALERQASLAARREALKPDCVKLRDFAKTIRTLPVPDFSDPEVWGIVNNAIDTLAWAAQAIEDKAANLEDGTVTAFCPQGGFVQLPEVES